jgi:hypothetical protein
MHTEEEAKTKRCPFMDGPPCIASACMAWRWERTSKNLQSHPATQTRTKTDHGYCGMAGKE